MTETPSEVRRQDETGDEETEPTVADQVGELLTKVRSKRRRFSRVKNLLTDVDGKEPDSSDYETWLQVRQGLEGYELGIEEVDEKRRALVERLGKVVDKLSIKARMKFMAKIEGRADDRDLDVEKVSEHPLVLYVDPLTFEVDFDEGGVEMLFGHELIDEYPIDASALMQGYDEAVERLEDRVMASEMFFDKLHDAYRTVLVADGAESGERVDLVDVLVPLAMLRADRTDMRKKGPEALESFSRPMLAYQLAKLRRDGLLEKEGLRLDLGAATGGSTRDKDDVLFIPLGADGGQYYGSLRFEDVS